MVSRPDDEVAGRFVDALGRRGLRVEHVTVDDPHAVVAAAADAARTGSTAVCSVGGDGSVNLVAQGLLSVDDHDTVLAPVPNGTVNLVNHVLDLDTPDDTIAALDAQRSRSIDVGETEAGVFVLNASSGYDAAVIGDGEDHSDSMLGRVRFLVEGARRLRRDEPVPVTVTCDGHELFAGRAMSVLVLNFGQRGGESFDVAPDARFDDGVLDVVVVRTGSLWRTVVDLARLAVGRQVAPADMVRAQATTVEVAWDRPVATQRDGDVDEPGDRLTYAVRPGALRILHA
ncbi:diacylglycerol/lipid kinase family protein [Ilumatobacter nonamiensis]|uniref:diacylglycerol/lipid kinase family protein n=1 Tax=Ilumatobacter nonamiensis TaxID=467093 RepID=UPI00034D0275|nr:diacylglycerol kinase family protein [Ilumatobacter nonamiensis]